ncbi:hypothetical protein OF83DRAFT_1280692 [Amylostereum chailletii]|nr:hypothetical protein OF83DRAFT_1280692 [Amylostereum chailletii]
MASSSSDSPVFSSELDSHQQQTLSCFYPSSSAIPQISSSASAPPEVQSFIRDLASAANKVANANACGSLLAGQGSESDDFGDVGVWLGEGELGRGHEEDALKALGLQSWAGSGKICVDELQRETCLPLTFKPSSSTAEVQTLTELLSRLQDKVYFYVERGSGEVAHFLLGKLSVGTVSGWAGLAGIGITSD